MTLEEKMFRAVTEYDQDYFKNLPQNVNLNAQNKQGNTLLHLLVSTRFVPNEIGVANIFKHHPDPFIENKNGMTPRMLAVWLGHSSQAAFLAAYETSYAERQRRFQAKCQAEALISIADMISHYDNCPMHSAKEIAERMRRGANGRAD